MKRLKLIMIVILGVALTSLYSCAKDDDPADNGSGGGGTSSGACKVVKQVNDDGSYILVKYNADNLVSEAQDFDSLNNLKEKRVLTYNNKLIQKMEVFEGVDAVFKYEFHYNSQNQIDTIHLFTKDAGSFENVSNVVYTYSGSVLEKSSLYVDINNTMSETSRKEYTFSGENLTKLKVYHDNGTTLALVKTTTYTYDDKVNPFHGIGIDYIDADPMFMSKNNYTKSVVENGSGVVDKHSSVNISYEYKKDKYPTKSTMTNLDNSFTKVTLMEYDCN